MYTWHRVPDIMATSFKSNELTEVKVEGKAIGLLKKDDKIFAFAALCPHAGAALCMGWLDAAGRIVCPLHLYRFDPANGRNTSGEGYKLKTYPVEVREDFIFIGLLQTT